MGKRYPFLLVLIAFLCLVMLGFLIFDDFGGYYTHNYYAGIKTWEYLNIAHGVSGPFIWMQILCSLGIFSLMVIGLIKKNLGARKGLYIASIILNTIIFTLAFIGGIVVAVTGEAGDYDDWWFGGSFYAGISGPVLMFIPLLIMSIKGGKSKLTEE